MLPILKHVLRRVAKRPSTIITTLLATFLLIPLILYHLLAYLLANDPRLVSYTFRRANSILFVTAHPDDESLFFSPTLLYREDDLSVERSLLVLSSGNYDGEGSTRHNELQAACAVAGIRADRCIGLDHRELQDNPKKWWDEELIAEVVARYVKRWEVDLIVTFDDGGISGHLNHRAVFGGVSIPAYALQTKSLIRKNFGLIDLIPTCIYGTDNGGAVHARPAPGFRDGYIRRPRPAGEFQGAVFSGTKDVLGIWESVFVGQGDLFVS
ncbi:PIG-L family deacetylase [Aspergillus affinis]|uniref:PIG-L family deacetylase n=1 Tax=Aspergillus affinis TaxID=1070780 RepID=UPI0022FDEA69|nr:LmbE-like protein [Aspergillus affinis]KAI9045500.1 LmbE-like protein [Aspergillus affinis]